MSSVTVMGPPMALDGLRAQVLDRPALSALSQERYAYAHARYEAARDQRLRLQTWLVTEMPQLLADRDPVRVVAVGAGDGSVDAPLAVALAADGRRVHYVGVEPHAPSATAFKTRLDSLHLPTLNPSVVVDDFGNFGAGHQASSPVDLVHFVHSLYYVADLSAALDRGLSLLGPGGVLLAATAPLKPLCVLTELLCPWDGRTPWFAADVRAEFDARGLAVRTETLVGHLDVRDALSDPLGRGEAVMDFLIGARSRELRPSARARLLEYVGDISLPGRPGVLPHPVDVTIVRVP